MSILIVFLLIGAVAGYLLNPGPRGMRYVNFAQTVGVVLLIALMGFSLGQIDDILGQLARLGATSAVFALLSTAGSALVVWLILYVFGEKGRKA